VSSSARAVALAEAVGVDIKDLTAQLQASNQQITDLQDALVQANAKIKELTERLDAMTN